MKKLRFSLLWVLFASSSLPADPTISPDIEGKARQLHQREQRGEKLSASLAKS
jgi:hypothetical protein